MCASKLQRGMVSNILDGVLLVLLKGCRYEDSYVYSTSLGFQTSVVPVCQDKDIYSGRTDIEAKYNQ